MELLLANMTLGSYFIIGACLVLQWILAIVALIKLFGDKVKAPGCVFWNLFIVLGVFVGPITYIIKSKMNKRKYDERQ